MILKFQEQIWSPVPNGTEPETWSKKLQGDKWTIYGEVSEVQYGEQIEIKEDRKNVVPGIAAKVILDESDDFPVFRLICFKQNGERHSVATQLHAFLCNDNGDTIEKI